MLVGKHCLLSLKMAALTRQLRSKKQQRKLVSRVEAFFSSEWLLRGRRVLLMALVFTVMAAIVYQVMKFVS